LRKEFPPGVIELSAIPGLSISKIRALHEELGVTSVGELRAAAEAGLVRNVKGFGAKTEEKLLESMARGITRENRRLHLHLGERTGEELVKYVEAGGATDVSVAGSLRRWKETVGTIRIVASAKIPQALLDHFLLFPLIVEVEEQMNGSCTVVLAEG